MKKRVVSLVLAFGIVAASLLGACGNSNEKDDNSSTAATTEAEGKAETSDKTEAPEDENTSSEAEDKSEVDTTGVTISLLNTKSEIQTQFEELAETYYNETGVTLEVYVTTGDSPAQDIAKRYAAGDPPTLIMGDPLDIAEIAAEKGIDLGNEEWVADGGEAYGIYQNGTLYSFPFCIEARGLIYNKTIIEEITGEEFVSEAITNLDDFTALLEKLVAGGMEYPVVLNKEDWSLAGHYLTQVYEEQDGTAAGADTWISGLKDGTIDLAADTRFTSLMDTFDVLKQYNINQADAMAADYDLNASYVAEGESAFWFNGNWAWAEISTYIEEGTEMGILPVVQNNTEGNENVNSYLCGGATKKSMIEHVKATEAEQQAAKDFLDWLVYNEQGQDFLVNACDLVPAFSNINLEITNPLGISVKEYVDADRMFESYINIPGDHWSTLGASMQKYLADQVDRAGLAEELTVYWQEQ